MSKHFLTVKGAFQNNLKNVDLKLPLNEFIVVSCSFCGLIQLYDPTIVDRVSKGWVFLDFLTGS